MSPDQPVLGVIADDITGATDLANTLVCKGMRVTLSLGRPAGPPALQAPCDALVVALKIRSIEPESAVAAARQALAWLNQAGCRQFFSKYCSTFDSTERGNIGPVAAALATELGSGMWVACPAFPDNGRTVYQGHLFVHDRLLSESGMRHHPLNPMTDPDLVRFLGRQVPGRVGLLPLPLVLDGPAAVRAELGRLRAGGTSAVILDAVTNEHLHILAEACADEPLITGGSGMALGLPDAYRRRGWLAAASPAVALPRIEGPGAVLAGSCSPATLRQIHAMARRCPLLQLTLEEPGGLDLAFDHAIAWVRAHRDQAPLLIATSADPETVATAQRRFGPDSLGHALEALLARIAVALVHDGFRKLIVAGGETSGAVVQALGIASLQIGPEIDPGVPWTVSQDAPRLALALKSGNFGRDDFFLRALEMIP